MNVKKIHSKKGFIVDFIYLIIGLLIAVTVLPTLGNVVTAYTGAYASIVKLITLVTVAGLVFVALRFGLSAGKGADN
jgi:hypothetical protein